MADVTEEVILPEVKTGVFEENNQTFCIVETMADLGWCKEYMRLVESATIDTETVASERALELEAISKKIKGATRNDNVLLGVGISRDETSGFYIPICKNSRGQQYLDSDLHTECMAFLDELMKSEIRWCGHNIGFETRVLKRYLSRPKYPVLDTMWSAHELDENGNLGLKQLGVENFGETADEEKRNMLLFFQAAGYKKIEMGKLDKIPMQVVGKYCIKDTILTMLLANKHMGDLAKNNMSERMKFRMSFFPVMEELCETGWPIDEKVLLENSKIISAELQDIVTQLQCIFQEEKTIIENEVLAKMGISSGSSVLRKMLVDRDGIEECFRVKAKGLMNKNGTPKRENKNVGEIVLSKQSFTDFVETPQADGTMSKDFFLWDGKDTADLSSETLETIYRYYKEKKLEADRKKAEEDNKDYFPYLFNPNSGTQLARLLYDLLKLPVLIRSKTTDLPSTGKDALKRTRKAVMHSFMTQDEIEGDYGQCKTWEDKLKYWQNYTDEVDWVVDPINKTMDPVHFKALKTVCFLDLMLQFRDYAKVNSTYLKGLPVMLYSNADLGRPPMVSRTTGNEIKWLISNINLCGTKTSRPSSCLIGSSRVTLGDGSTKTIKELVDNHNPEKPERVLTHKGRSRPIKTAWATGKKQVFKLTTKSGKTITATDKHRFLTESGEWKQLGELAVGDKIMGIDE